jgi:hypothetical protein
MRFVLCLLLIATMLPGSALAAKRSFSIAQAEAAAARGDTEAAAALSTTIDQQLCLSECANRGIDKGQCAAGCRRGLCHTGGEHAYCVAK